MAKDTEFFTVGKIATFFVMAFATWLLVTLFQSLLGPATAAANFIKDLFTGVGTLGTTAKNQIAEAFNEVGDRIESEGFATSDGQNDPKLLYNLARVAFADRMGLTGSDRFVPEGFPSFDDWIAAEIGGA